MNVETSHSEAELEVWKRKYFDSLQALERKECHWSSMDALLRGAVARMTVALCGIDAELDRELEQLRATLRNESDPGQLESLTRRIAQMLDRLESKAPVPQRAGALFTRLWSARAQRGARAAGGVDAPAARTALRHLLDQLELDECDLAERERLKRDLGETEIDWPMLLHAVADLLARSQRRLQHQRRQIEQFFSQLGERLQRFDDLLRAMESSRADAAQETRQLDASLREQVQDLHTNMDGAVDLEQLKHVMQQRLDALGEHVRRYMRSQENRSRAAQQRIEELSSKLVSLEAETGELRARIHAERLAAQTDVLTGVYNRLAYEERIELEFARWKRFGTPVAMAVLDIDHFKAINDRYGHQAGDKVLTTIAAVLAGGIRETDFLARYGGEEFVLIMPGADTETGLQVAEKLRNAVQGCGFHYRGDAVPITVSCGVTAFRDPDSDSTRAVFARADQAMYQAKAHGRNRCCAAPD